MGQPQISSYPQLPAGPPPTGPPPAQNGGGASADAVQRALQRLAASGHSAAGGSGEHRAPPSLPPGGVAMREEIRAAPPPAGFVDVSGMSRSAPSLSASRPPPPLPPPPPGTAHGDTLAGESAGWRGMARTMSLLQGAKKHRKPPPLPAHVREQLEQERRAKQAASPRASSAPATRAAKGGADKGRQPLAPVLLTGSSTADGTPLTTPLHRRPPPLPTGGAISAALHSRQHTRSGSAARARKGGAARAAGGAAPARELRTHVEAEGGAEEDVEELVTLEGAARTAGGGVAGGGAMAWRADSPLHSPASSEREPPP